MSEIDPVEMARVIDRWLFGPLLDLHRHHASRGVRRCPWCIIEHRPATVTDPRGEVELLLAGAGALS